MLFNRFSVRLGEWDQSTEKDCFTEYGSEIYCAPPVQDIRIESYKVHEMYNDALSVNDIMVIKLEHPVKYARNIKTICLPTNENELITKAINLEQLTITGWKKNEQRSDSDIMLFAENPFIPSDECREKLIEKGIDIKLYESHICAGGDDMKDSCLGIDNTNNSAIDIKSKSCFLR